MTDEQDSAKAGINRRRLIRDAGAAAAGVAVAAAGAEALLESGQAAQAQVPLSQIDPDELVEPVEPPGIKGDVLSGEIIAIEGRRLVLRPFESAPVTVNVVPDAHVPREGETSLSDFRLGDEVVVLGERRGSEFTAVGVTVRYRLKEATIYSRDDRALQTSEGEILLLPWTITKGGVWNEKLYQGVPLDELKPGDEILAFGLVNQRSGTMVADLITVSTSVSDHLIVP